MPSIIFRTYRSKAFCILLMLFSMVNLAHAAPPIRISPNNLSKGEVSTPYAETLTGSNGTTPYQWSITAGILPPGLVFSPSPSPSLTADISGTPSQSGTFTFTVTLRDSSVPQQSVTNTYSITVIPPCSFAGTNIGSLSFNAIDPSVTPGPILGTVTQQILVYCKKNFTYTVTANPATGLTIDSGPYTIPYTLGYITGGVGTGVPFGVLTNATQLTQPNYMNAPAGLYANGQPVTITISWVQAGGGSIVATIPIGSVSGTVINTCTISQAPGTLTFDIDPSVPGTTSALISPDMQIKCTKNDSVSISSSSKCGGAAPKLDTAYPACGGSQIPYTFNFTPNIIGQGFGIGLPLNISGTANSVHYENAPAGNYGDLQTLTITY